MLINNTKLIKKQETANLLLYKVDNKIKYLCYVNYFYLEFFIN
nr:MAG TPA_asm: hypothetical protein [Caudoviricetes sp.]